MKVRKILALLMALAVVTAFLAGCGASSAPMENGGAADMAPEVEAPAMDAESSLSGVTGDSVNSTAYAEQKLIKTVRINAETEDLETLLGQLTQQIRDMGGYVERQEIYNDSMYSSYRYRSAQLTVRIPADQLDSFVGEVKGLSNVVTYNEEVDDVTTTYVDTESRIAALETERDRLMELLEKAETMSDLLEIEARLTQVQYELESYSSQLRVLQNKVSYATVNLYIDQVKVYTDVEDPTVWERISKGFGKNLKNLGDGLVDFIVWVVTYSPQLIFWAAVITGGTILVRRIIRKRRAKKIPPVEEETE